MSAWNSSRPLFGRGGALPVRSITATTNMTRRKKLPSLLVLLVVFGGLLLWQGSRPLHRSSAVYYSTPSAADFDILSALASVTSSSSSTNNAAGTDRGPLGIPTGEAVALPNDRNVFDADIDALRKAQQLGGVGDALHLGGFAANIDLNGVSPVVWKHMVTDYNVKSVLDLGCGRGFSAAWFDTHGVRIRAVDGSADALEHSVVSAERRSHVLVEHDFARGAWWPAETYDAIWSVDFLEHIGMHKMKFYLPTLRKAAYLFVAPSHKAGWHHVEIHAQEWWIDKMESWGFRHSSRLTQQTRQWAQNEADERISIPFADNTHYNPQSISNNMLVFVNPVVASMPEHDHLLYEPGCFLGYDNSRALQRRPCGTSPEETKLPDSYLPITLTPEMDQAWEKLVVNAFGQDTNAVLSNNPVAAVRKKSTPKINPDLPELLQRIQQRNFTGMPIIPVVAWPYVTKGINTAEHKHIEENGINESPYLRLSKDLHDFSPHMVWVGDTGWGFGWNKWCGEFLQVIKETRNLRQKQGLPTKWPIFIVDFTDNVNVQRCKDIESYMGLDYVHYNTRSLGKERKWKEEKKWVEFGEMLNTTMENGKVYQHTPLVVRTDTVESLNHTLASRGMKLADPIEKIPRSLDVIHLWPIKSNQVNMQFANFRTRVSELLVDLGKKHNWTTFVGLAGKALRQGRRGVANEYIETLLNTKIVVLAQRDKWEDHYRLMEALISGSLVLHDFMHGLPAGLENGTSIVEYTTPQNLESLISYYLTHDEERMEVGRRGREVAMQRHRTWHRIEEVIFGEMLSTCQSKPPGGNCPYIVHGNEN